MAMRGGEMLFVPVASWWCKLLSELMRLLQGFFGRFFQLLCLFSSDLLQTIPQRYLAGSNRRAAKKKSAMCPWFNKCVAAAFQHQKKAVNIQ